MAELKQDPMHPLKHEQCYLCLMTLVEPPPPNAPSREQVRRPHKEYMAKLESEGRLFGAGCSRTIRTMKQPRILATECSSCARRPGRRPKRSPSQSPIPKRVFEP